jgi:hypothetical protein
VVGSGQLSKPDTATTSASRRLCGRQDPAGEKASAAAGLDYLRLARGEMDFTLFPWFVRGLGSWDSRRRRPAACAKSAACRRPRLGGKYRPSIATAGAGVQAPARNDEILAAGSEARFRRNDRPRGGIDEDGVSRPGCDGLSDGRPSGKNGHEVTV